MPTVSHTQYRLIIWLIWLLSCLFLLAKSWQEVTFQIGWDPDDQLRLVQLRDFLAGQALSDTSQARLNTPYGSEMHWSRLTEMPLAVIVLLLRPLLGQNMAEMVAGASIPLVLLSVAIWLLSDILRRIGRPGAAPTAVLVSIMTPSLLFQFMPMRIDHHGWQIMLACLAYWSLFLSSPKHSGVTLGIALALWLHISMEAAPLVAMFFVWLGWRWVFDIGDQKEEKRLFFTVATFAGLTLILYIIFIAKSLTAPSHCDAVSPAHIVAISFAALIMMPATLWTSAPRIARFGLAGCAGAGAAAIFAIMAQHCLSGGFADLDPLVREVWYYSVPEGLPVWQQPSWSRFALLFPPVIALFIIAFSLRHSDIDRSTLTYFTWFLIMALLLTLLVMRSAAIACAFAIPVIAIWVEEKWTKYRKEPMLSRRLRYIGVVFAVVMSGPLWQVAGGTLQDHIMQVHKAPKHPLDGNVDTENTECDYKAMRIFAQWPKAEFIAPFDLGPAILMSSKHSVLASSHHRNNMGMRDQILVFLNSADAAHKIVTRRGIDYILICPDNAEIQGYEHRAPKGFGQQLIKGKAPDWLSPVPLKNKALKLWRVVK